VPSTCPCAVDLLGMRSHDRDEREPHESGSDQQCVYDCSATTSSHVGFRKQSGGSVWESNPPNPTASGRISFED